MAKTVAPESMSAGITRMVGSLFPKHGNNTEARRAQAPQSSAASSVPATKTAGGGTDPKTEKALKDSDAY